jgi:hypothetical protein
MLFKRPSAYSSMAETNRSEIQCFDGLTTRRTYFAICAGSASSAGGAEAGAGSL